MNNRSPKITGFNFLLDWSWLTIWWRFLRTSSLFSLPASNYSLQLLSFDNKTFHWLSFCEEIVSASFVITCVTTRKSQSSVRSRLSIWEKVIRNLDEVFYVWWKVTMDIFYFLHFGGNLSIFIISPLILQRQIMHFLQHYILLTAVLISYY